MRKLTDLPDLIKAIQDEAAKPRGTSSWKPTGELLDFVSKYGMEQFQEGFGAAKDIWDKPPETTKG